MFAINDCEYHNTMLERDIKQPTFNHFQKNFAGKTYNWFGSDLEQDYKKHLITKYNDLKSLGWHDDSIQYRINQDGFRDDDFDSRDCGIAVGCSVTMGIGVPEESTWVRQLSRRLGIHIWNLGIGGGSGDVCFRIIDHYLSILHPRFVIFKPTSMYRHEFFIGSQWVQTLAPQINELAYEDFRPYLKNWFSYEENVVAQSRRNRFAIQHRCNETHTRLFIPQQPMTLDRKARDLMHPGIDSMNEFSEYMYSEKEKYFP